MALPLPAFLSSLLASPFALAPHSLAFLLRLAIFPSSAQTSPSMLSSSPTSCTSPNPDKENPSKKVQWASGRRRRTSSTDSESKSQSDPFRPRSRKPSRLTVKYDRGQLQRWVEMEQWVDTQVQELFQVGRTWRAWGLEGTREVLSMERKLFPQVRHGFAVLKLASHWSGLCLPLCIIWRRSFNISETQFSIYKMGLSMPVVPLL